MKIFVQTFKGTHFETEVNPQHTVADVKTNMETNSRNRLKESTTGPTLSAPVGSPNKATTSRPGVDSRIRTCAGKAQQISNQKVVGSPPTWRRRWFVLQQGTLLWFKDFSVTRASLPRGVIFVATCLPVKGAEDVLNKPFAFELSTARITESCGCQEGQPGVVDEVKEKALPHSGVLM
ncbi:hypothetical protein CsSME_00018675 [Camellia sinensis var. sinensis]